MSKSNIFDECDYVLMQFKKGFKVIKNKNGIRGERIEIMEGKRLLANGLLRVLVVNTNGSILTSNFNVTKIMQEGQRNRYFVDQIDRKDALEKLENHYLNRKPQISYAFGLFDRDRNNRLVSVITYGSPASPTLCKGLCGEEERLNVIEINRLWAETSVSNNALVFFITQTFSNVSKEIVVSFVQPENDRISRLLKLMGFYYTGLTKERTQRVNKDGTPSPHHRHNCYMKTTTFLVPAPRKHRFVYFNAGPERQHDLFEKLNYEVIPY